MKHLQLFENWRDELSTSQSQLAELDALRDFAIISAADYAQQGKSLLSKIAGINRKLLKEADATHPRWSADWLAEISKYPSLTWLTDSLASPELQSLLAKGFYPCSSNIQLGNRTLMLSKNPNYSPLTDTAIGFFSSINVVRRIVQKPNPKSTYMDQKLKELDGGLSPVEFMKQASLWVQENLVLEVDYFPSKRAHASDVKKVNQAELMYSTLEAKFAERGVNLDRTQIKALPIRGLYHGSVEMAKLIKLLQKQTDQSKPLELPLNEWSKYTQSEIDAMSNPNLIWTVSANGQLRFGLGYPYDNNIPTDISRLNIKLESTTILDYISAASAKVTNQVLAKLSQAGLKYIQKLEFPTEEVDLEMYPTIQVNEIKNIRDRRR
jgi:hypothetical protein